MKLVDMRDSKAVVCAFKFTQATDFKGFKKFERLFHLVVGCHSLT